MATIVTLKDISSKQLRAAVKFIAQVEITEGWTTRPLGPKTIDGDEYYDIEVSFAREEDAGAFKAHVLDPSLKVQGYDFSGPIG